MFFHSKRRRDQKRSRFISGFLRSWESYGRGWNLLRHIFKLSRTTDSGLQFSTAGAWCGEIKSFQIQPHGFKVRGLISTNQIAGRRKGFRMKCMDEPKLKPGAVPPRAPLLPPRSPGDAEITEGSSLPANRVQSRVGNEGSFEVCPGNGWSEKHHRFRIVIVTLLEIR